MLGEGWSMSSYDVSNIECCYCNVCGKHISIRMFVDQDGLCNKCIDNFITECSECGREISCNKLWGMEGICEYCNEY